MSYSTGRAFRQALESRLRMQSLQTATPLVRLRKLVVFDRFFARLSRVPPPPALLDGRTFENFHVDVGVGDPVIGAAEVLVMPPVLAFAVFEATAFPAYPLTQHIAEKVHAYTQAHPTAQRTRVRDLVDLLLIASHATFDST